MHKALTEACRLGLAKGNSFLDQWRMRNEMKIGSLREIHKVLSISDSIIGLKIVLAYA